MLDNGMFRIPGSRPCKISPKKDLATREQSWDNRFHLGRIPEYNSYHDRFLQNKFGASHRRKLFVGSRIRRKPGTSTNHLKNSTSSKSIQKPQVVKNQILKKLKESLMGIWEIKAIPYIQREIFLKAIEKIPAKKQSSVIVKEISMLKADKSSVQLVLRAINAREHSIKIVKELAETIEVASSVVKQNSVESLLDLRMLSLHVVECIQAWRKGMNEIDPELNPNSLKFFWENSEYMVRMQKDTSFLAESAMARFVNFDENDPFFLHSSEGKVEIPVAGYLSKRLADAEAVLRSEGFRGGESNNPRIAAESARVNSSMQASPVKAAEPLQEKHVADPSKDLTADKPSLPKEVIFEPSIGDISLETQEYHKQVPIILQDSMGKPSLAFAHALTMQFPAFLWAKVSNERVGLIALNLENQKSVHKRLHISHISAKSIEIFNILIEETVKYIWKHYNCMEIRVGIISKINEQGKYESEKSVKQCFDRLGFRWKQMIYAMNETPVQLLGLRRADECVNSGKIDIFDDCIEISYGCVVQGGSSSSQLKESEYSSAVGVACAVKPIGTTDPFFLELIQKLKVVPPAFRFRKDSSLELVERDLKSVQLSMTGLIQGLDTSISCSALSLSWNNFFPMTYKGISYTKIYSEVEIMKSGDKVVYIIATEDPLYSAFIIPTVIDSKHSPFIAAKEILDKLEKSAVTNELWIPSFLAECENEIHCLGDKVSVCKEKLRITLTAALHPKGSYHVDPGRDAVIVSNNFLFGMIHQKIDEELELPLYVVKVTPDCLIRIG